MLDVALKGSWKISASLAVMLWVFTFLIAPEFPGPISKAVWKGLEPLIVLCIWFFGLIAFFKLLRGFSNSTSRSVRTINTNPRTPNPFPDTQGVDALGGSEIESEPAWSLSLIRQIEWKLFEDLSAAYYREKGIRAETTSLGADGGIDIKLYQDNSSEPTGLVQCKAWSRQVGVREIREFLGVLSHEKISKGFYMTSASFSEDAKSFAASNGITLITGEMLLMMIHRLPKESQEKLLRWVTRGDYTTPTCPNCGVKMVRRSSERGEFWGCRNYPRCRRILNMPRVEAARTSSTLRY